MKKQTWEQEFNILIKTMLEKKGYNIPSSQEQWLNDLIKYIRVKASTNHAITYKQKIN